MPGAHWDGLTDLERLTKRIKELEDQVTALQAAGTHLPFVDNDPAVQYGNIWGMNDNRIRIRKPDGTIREIITTAPGASGSGTLLPPVPAQPQTHQATWAAAWSQGYRQNGQQRADTTLHQGYGNDSFNGNQTSLIGWPYATIATALAGASITAVEVYLYVTHCWWNAGATAGFASHNNASAPATLAGITTGIVSTAHVQGTDQGGKQGWHSISTQFGGWLRDGASKGLTLSPQSTDHQFYCVTAGVGSGLPVPQIRVTYVK
jgi:hypothetical protein